MAAAGPKFGSTKKNLRPLLVSLTLAELFCESLRFQQGQILEKLKVY